MLHKPLDNTTVTEFMQEIKGKAHHFVAKYENSLYKQTDKSLNSLRFYRQVKDIYFDLYILLLHINNYNSLYDKINCNSCKFDEYHRNKLRRDFDKWKILILKCKDGQFYKDL